MSNGNKCSHREASRKSWVTQNEKAYMEEINMGSFQRIADATEAMAKNHTALIAEKERYKRNSAYWMQRAEEAERSNAALRGHITRLKKRIN